MEEKELNEQLSNAQAPRIKLPEAKMRLRNELTSATVFRRKRTFTNAFQPKLALSAATLVALAFLYSINFGPEGITAKNLVRDLDAAYGLAHQPDKVHYLNFLIRENEDEPVEVEAWAYRDGEKARFLRKNPQTEEIQGHTLIVDQKTYWLEGGRPLQSAPRAFDNGPDVRYSREEIAEKAAAASRVSLSLRVLPAEAVSDSLYEKERLLHAYLLPQTFDFAAFILRSPKELVDRLMRESAVAFVASEFDSVHNQEMLILESRPAKESMTYKLEFPEKRLDQLAMFCQKLISDEALTSASRSSAWRQFEEGFRAKKVEAFERIRILAETTEIQQAKLIIYENAAPVYRAVKTFIADEYMAYTQDIFDPEVHGLVLYKP